MIRYAAAALLLTCAAAPHAAFAQQAQPQDLETLMREMREFAFSADEHFKTALEQFEGYGYGRSACEHAVNAVKLGIKSRNRIIWARRLLPQDSELYAQLGELLHDSSKVLNIYKRLYNEHCGNEPYEMTPE